MSARLFNVEEPEQLRTLAEYKKNGQLVLLGQIWSAERRRTGAANMDRRIYVLFSGDKMRSAKVVRKLRNGSYQEYGDLKYTTALAWCRENLKEA